MVKRQIDLVSFKIAFLLLFFTGINYAKAQEVSFLDKLELGIKGGTNVGSVISDANNRMNVRATYQIGFLAEYSISEKFSFQPELLYTRQGENDRGVQEGVRFRNVLMLDYVAMPLMLNFNLFDGAWVETGIQPAVLVRAEYDQVLGSENQVQSVRGKFNDFDALYNIGLRYKTDWGFFIGLRYSVGLTNVLNYNFNGATSMRHSVYQFNFGYFF